MLQTVLDSLTHPFYVIDVESYHVRLANRAARQMHQSDTATCYALAHGRSVACETSDHACPLRIVTETKQPAVVEHVHCDHNGQRRDVQIHAFPIVDAQGNVTQVIEYCVDVTEPKRMVEKRRRELAVNRALAELADALIDPSFSIEQVADTVLEQARRLTGSAHGYVSSIDPETGANVGHTLTHMMGDQCRVPADRQSIVFHPDSDGRFSALFGHALNTGLSFYTNCPAEHPASTGLPPGHIPVKNFLTAPARVGSKVVGQIALANSENAYGDEDLEAIGRMAQLYALAIQRRYTEMALKRSEERYALAQTAAHIGSWDWNIVTGTLVWSERIEPMFGFAEGRFAGTYEAFLNCVHPEDRDFVVASVNACVENGADYAIEHRIVWPDGTVRWVSETGDVVRSPEGKAIRMLGVVQDITKRKEVERAVVDLAKFASENPSPVLRVCADGTILYANGPGHVLLNKWHTRPGRAVPDEWGRQIAEVLAGNDSRAVEVECEGRIFSLALVPIAEADYVNIYGRDVTEQKRAEQQSRELNEQLERRVLERTAEVAKTNEQLRKEIEERKRLEREIIEISEREQRRFGRELHDSLGQQLTGIAIITKVLEQKLQRQSVAEAASAAEIAQLVNEAINQTRQLSRGLHPVALDEHGLMTALQALASTTRNVFGVACDFQCSRPVAVTDTSVATHLYRIAQEAVTNAIRHGKTRQITLELTADGGDATLIVENDGRSFPRRLPKDRGMGLLVMSYRAEMIGGRLTVERRSGGGTKVTCTFNIELCTARKETQHARKSTRPA